MKKLCKLMINSVIGAIVLYLFFILLSVCIEFIVGNKIIFVLFMIVGVYTIIKLLLKEF